MCNDESFVEALTEDKFNDTVFPEVFLDLSFSKSCSSSTVNPSDSEVSDLVAFYIGSWL